MGLNPARWRQCPKCDHLVEIKQFSDMIKPHLVSGKVCEASDTKYEDKVVNVFDGTCSACKTKQRVIVYQGRVVCNNQDECIWRISEKEQELGRAKG